MLMKLIKLELIKWKRTNMSLFLLFIFSFSGIVSPIFTKYSNYIIKSVSNSDTKIYFTNITWETLMQSYFKNTSQIIFFISIYIICNMCLLPKIDSKKYFYTTRADKSRKIYIPKYTASILNLFVSLLLGGLGSVYVTYSFFPDINFSNVVVSIFLQIIGFISLISIAILLAIMIGSSFLSSVIIELLIIFSSILNNIEVFKEISPTNLIIPEKSIYSNLSLHSLPKSLYVSISLIILVFCILNFLNLNNLFRRGRYFSRA